MYRGRKGDDQDPASTRSFICSGFGEPEADSNMGIGQGNGCRNPRARVTFDEEFVLTTSFPPWIPAPQDTQTWQSC